MKPCARPVAVNLSIDLSAAVRFLISKSDKWRSVNAPFQPKLVSEASRRSGDLLTEFLGHFHLQNKTNTCWQRVGGVGAAAEAEEEIPAALCSHMRVSQSITASAQSLLCCFPRFSLTIQQ